MLIYQGLFTYHVIVIYTALLLRLILLFYGSFIRYPQLYLLVSKLCVILLVRARF